MPNRPHQNQCNMINQGSDTIVEKLKSYCMLYMIGFYVLLNTEKLQNI